MEDCCLSIHMEVNSQLHVFNLKTLPNTGDTANTDSMHKNISQRFILRKLAQTR